MATLQEMEDGEAHSLPMYGEVEGQKRTKKRNSIIIAVVLILLVVAIVGLSVGISKNKTKSTSPDTATAPSTQSGDFGGGNENDSTNSFEPLDPAPSLDIPDEVGEEEATTEEVVTEEEPTGTATTPESTTPESTTQTPESFPQTETPVADATSAPEETQTNLTNPTSRFDYILEFLVSQNAASRTELETEGTYANKALNWIANEDLLMLPIPVSVGQNRTTNLTPLTEEETFKTRFVMVLLYYALGGPKWEHKANFLSDKPTCEWMEIIDSLPVGVGCTPKDGRVRSLFLNNNKLQNHLPSEIGLLTDLIMLDLDTNFVMGTIPDSFQALTQLEHLHLGSTGLTGTLPSWLGTFRNLGSLNLGYNVMHGTIPSEITLLPALRELALDHNAFEGDINALFSNGGLSTLEDLFLDSNTFIGELGADFASNMVNLTQLDLSDNAFEGSVPEHFFTFAKLQVLDIHDNNFTSLPTIQASNNTALKFFAAQKNALSGNMDDIVHLSALTHLDLSQNQLTGDMPPTLGEEVPNLTYLFLAENQFNSGEIPVSFSNLFLLKELSLKSTQRTGGIPNVVGMMTELVFLDLDNNFLEGDIPSTLGSLTNLKVLLLNRNNLVNEIPPELGQLAHLDTFFLEGNNITGGLNWIYACNIPDSQADIVAQCSLCNSVPDCCTHCCEEEEECNTKIHVADLDPIWQLTYKRDDYALEKEDLWG